MATEISHEKQPVAQEVKENKGTGFVAAVHAKLDRARMNVKQRYQDLLDLLSSVTKEWVSPDDKAGSGVNNTLQGFGLETGLIQQQVQDRFQQFVLSYGANYLLGQRMSSFRVPPAVNNFWESCKKYAAENPVMAMTILALVITCAIPVITFLSFALVTLLVTFIGFLFVEGTLLGIASVFLGGVLLIVGFFTLTAVSFGLLAYLVVSKVYTYITGDTEPQRYLAKLPLIGYLFANIDHSGANGDAVKIPNGYEEDDAASDESLAHTD